ncbi:hypothetical protein AGMMS50276_22710 [Synergistales bacterium]|nr:hypothetical protein AGMMS50276_22710 [Synergistales bacterium]
MNASSGTGWNFSGGVLTITGNGSYIIEGTGAATTNRIVVQPGVAASVLLRDANINVNSMSDTCAFDMYLADVTLYLEGTNTLTSGAYRAGLEVRDGSKLTITSMAGDGSFNGTLNATGGSYAAGIGGWGSDSTIVGRMGLAGEITIYGGTITANGGVDASGNGGAAGIGGGNTNIVSDGGGVITINGGMITAIGSGGTAGSYSGAGAGIGSAAAHARIGDTIITLNGGTITAIGGYYPSSGSWPGESAAGIGGGYLNQGGMITINSAVNGPTITAHAAANLTQDLYRPAENIGHGQGTTSASTVYYIVTPPPPPCPVFVPPQTGGSGGGGQSETEEKGIPLREISNFYNANGVFSVYSPQTITIYQGDGKSAKVTLYENDTLYDAAQKINDAIARDLGQGAYVGGANCFCTISDGTPDTSESVYREEPVYSDPEYDASGKLVKPAEIVGYKIYATMLIRSAIPGAAGEMTFTGDEDVLKALGLNTIQQSHESEFSVTIYDAHSGKLVNPTQIVSGNMIYGAITDNVDVKFDPLANINVSWNEKMKQYEFARTAETTTTFVHLADNTMMLQIGANEGEDMSIHIGDTRSESLGLNRVLVIGRGVAARSITIIDSAIDKVSSLRTRLGAYQNRLKHTVTNLTTASANTTAAESCIRDADMSMETLNSTRLRILTQSGTAMLAQANQLPRTVISLIRG